MPITIRPAVPGDAPTLIDFNAAMALETEHLTLDPQILSRGVRAGLGDPAKARYFVAEIESRIVGQLMLTLEWSDWRDGEIWWIQSVYVHPDFRRRGVFKALYRHAQRLARERGAVGLRLYVEKHNVAAQSTYGSLGMRMSEYLVMEELGLRT
jgi:ribosomal protein S18 acetylase RimI-like enzyme